MMILTRGIEMRYTPVISSKKVTGTYSPDEEAHIFNLYQRGWMLKDIGECLGLGTEQVMNKIKHSIRIGKINKRGILRGGASNDAKWRAEYEH
jgi:hypothetical protein